VKKVHRGGQFPSQTPLDENDPERKSRRRFKRHCRKSWEAGSSTLDPMIRRLKMAPSTRGNHRKSLKKKKTEKGHNKKKKSFGKGLQGGQINGLVSVKRGGEAGRGQIGKVGVPIRKGGKNPNKAYEITSVGKLSEEKRVGERARTKVEKGPCSGITIC